MDNSNAMGYEGKMMTQTHTTNRYRGLTRCNQVKPLIRVYQLPTAAIQYLTALAEAADGIGLVRTLDEDRGIIECWIMPDFQTEFDRLIEHVGQQWPLMELGEEFE